LIDYFVSNSNKEYFNIIDENIIDQKSISYSKANDYYNKFVIGIYPILTARDVYDYEYEVELFDSLKIKRTQFFHETLLSVVTIIAGTPTFLKFDWFDGVNFFTNGTLGSLTGLRRNFSVGLENETIQKKLKSLAENENIEKVWNDTKNNNNAGVLKFTKIDGAFWVGNRIIQTMYNQRIKVNFEYPETNHLRVGSYVNFKNTNYIIIEKTLQKDFLRYNYKLEEVLL
jgi:hypothetical protein